MRKETVSALVLGSLLLASATAVAQDTTDPPAFKSSAEIRVQLPPGGSGPVSVIPGDRQVLLELPRGAVFPLDLSSSSGGLLRGGEVLPMGADRVRLRLDLAVGLLDRVEFEEESVLLVFQSRFDVARGAPHTEDSYVLGADDKLLITILNHPELTSRPTVTDEGTITAPLVGDMVVAGMSPRQVAGQLTELLGRSYLVDPQVDVEVEEFRSQWVMITGEVQLPGRVFLRGGTRLKEVLSEAGGLADSAGETITISRRVEETGEYVALTINRVDFETGVSDPILEHGDILDVPRSTYCYLQGEVRSPGRVQVERGLTLLRALSLVGGLSEWADRKAVRVLYRPGSEPRERIFNVKRIQAGKDEDPILEGGEVIVVPRRFF